MKLFHGRDIQKEMGEGGDVWDNVEKGAEGRSGYERFIRQEGI
jgi:hypothetical protein